MEEIELHPYWKKIEESIVAIKNGKKVVYYIYPADPYYKEVKSVEHLYNIFKTSGYDNNITLYIVDNKSNCFTEEMIENSITCWIKRGNKIPTDEEYFRDICMMPPDLVEESLKVRLEKNSQITPEQSEKWIRCKVRKHMMF